MTRDELLRRYKSGERNFDQADLRGVDLSDVDLRGASFIMADLRGADLRRANLCDTDLGGADLRGAMLSDMYLICADLFMCKVHQAQLMDIAKAIGMVLED